MDNTMFQCQKCGSTQFNLAVQPGFKGDISVTTNADDDVVIVVNGKEFVADLMFMNQFAVCLQCDAIKSWAYFFPNVQSEA